MTSRSGGSAVPFLLIAVLVLTVSSYLAWHMWQAPIDPQEAAAVASRATDVTVRAAGGDAGACPELRDFTADSEVDAALSPCADVAARAGASGVSLSVVNLKVTDVDVGRSSGSVTVEGTVLTPGPSMSMRFTSPLEHRDGHWRLSGGPDVKTG